MHKAQLCPQHMTYKLQSGTKKCKISFEEWQSGYCEREEVHCEIRKTLMHLFGGQQLFDCGGLHFAGVIIQVCGCLPLLRARPCPNRLEVNLNSPITIKGLVLGGCSKARTHQPCEWKVTYTSRFNAVRVQKPSLACNSDQCCKAVQVVPISMGSMLYWFN